MQRNCAAALGAIQFKPAARTTWKWTHAEMAFVKGGNSREISHVEDDATNPWRTHSRRFFYHGVKIYRIPTKDLAGCFDSETRGTWSGLRDRLAFISVFGCHRCHITVFSWKSLCRRRASRFHSCVLLVFPCPSSLLLQRRALRLSRRRWPWGCIAQ